MSELGALIRATFDSDLAAGRPVRASSVRGGSDHVGDGSDRFAAAHVTDGDAATYWCVDDGTLDGWLEIDLGAAQLVTHVMLQEHIALGQRVKRFRVEAGVGGEWSELAEGTTIGHKRILPLPATLCERVRVQILDAKAAPTLRRIGVFRAPPQVEIECDAEAFLETTTVALTADLPGAEMRYTLDGSLPTRNSNLYEQPLSIGQSCELTALAFFEGEAGLIADNVQLVRHAKETLAQAVSFFREPDAGLKYSYYEESWQTLDSLSETEPAGTGVVRSITLEPRQRETHFGLAFEGWLQVPADGLYRFRCTSDDGSRLAIAGRTVVDNDGLHGRVEKAGWIGLQAGFHALRLEYFNAVGEHGLQVEVEGPGLARRELPADWLFQ